MTGLRRWTKEEDEVIRQRYPHERAIEVGEMIGRSASSVQGRAWKLGIKKSDEFLRTDACGRITNGNGMAARYGAASKCNRVRAIGDVRLNPDGNLEVKVSTNARTSRLNWIPVHRFMWEDQHGPVPEGHVVVFRDGNNRNFSLDNFELVSRAEQGRRNLHARFPPELRELITLKSLITQQVNRIINKHMEQ